MDRTAFQIWMAEAKNDFDAGKIMANIIHRKYNIAVFNFIQAAEKALKALLYLLSAQPWGHSHVTLLNSYEKLGHPVDPGLKNVARQLERHYITSRYPDASPNISPKDAYSRKDAHEMISQEKKKQFLVLFEEMVNQISKNIDVHAIILFGSQAKGTANEHSDYDLLIIAQFHERFLDRSKQLIPWLPDLPLDIFCYTPMEFEQLFRKYRLTAIDAVGEGIVLYGEAFISPYRIRYEGFISKGMKKLENMLIPPVN